MCFMYHLRLQSLLRADILKRRIYGDILHEAIQSICIVWGEEIKKKNSLR